MLASLCLCDTPCTFLAPVTQKGHICSSAQLEGHALPLAATANSSLPTLSPGKMVNVPLEQLPLLFKVVLHSCKTSVSKE